MSRPTGAMYGKCVRGDAALTAPVAPRDWKTWILWAMLIGAAVLIAGLALSLLRKPPTTH